MSTATHNTAKSQYFAFTARTGCIDRLWGPAQAVNRAAIISALLDKEITKSNPQAKWNRFRRAMLNLYDINGRSLCIAEEDDALAEACTAHQSHQKELWKDILD